MNYGDEYRFILTTAVDTDNRTSDLECCILSGYTNGLHMPVSLI